METDRLNRGDRVLHMDGVTHGEVVDVTGDWVIVQKDSGGKPEPTLWGWWQRVEKAKAPAA